MTPERKKELNAEWYKKNRERKKEHDAAYRLRKKAEMDADPEKTAEVNAKRMAAYNATRNARVHLVRNSLRKEIMERLGGICNRCGYSDLRACQIEHVYGDGATERKRLVTPEKCYRFILEEVKKGSDRYQVLCANCHIIKHLEEER